MGDHTANAGKVYFAAGTPDRDDARPDGTLDLAGSVTRELGEETGLQIGELALGDGWTAVVDVGRIAFMREVDIDLPAEKARALMLERMKTLDEEELSDIVIVRNLAETEKHDMPPFMRRYLAHIFEGD
jgi:8-oxo-dGTP pyrophosphatase MutT (NUDIX family)